MRISSYASQPPTARIVLPRGQVTLTPTAAFGPAIGNMTTHDYIMTMKTVRIAELKARLSEHLRYVRRGHVLTILDRDTPIARIVPMGGTDTLRVREPAKCVRKLKDVSLPAPVRVDVDVVDLLLEERQGER